MQTVAVPKSALVLMSGGQDSAVCLAWALRRFERVETLGFDYGQRHAIELAARAKVLVGVRGLFPDWAVRLGEDHRVDLRSYGALADSALTRDRPIETAAGGLPTTFVPGRNLVFLVYAAVVAIQRGLDVLVGGMCQTDYSGYPDCRRDTMDAMERSLGLGMGRDIGIETPLMHLSKAQTWALARELGGEPLVELIRIETHTCYLGERGRLHAWGHGCGACTACELRAKGWFEHLAETSERA